MLSVRRGPGGDRQPDPAALDLFRLQVSAGAVPDDVTALSARCRRAVAVAGDVGAPLLLALDAAQQAEDDLRRAERAVSVASAQTKAVASGLVLAPLLLVPGLGRILGTDLLAFYSTAVGLAVLAAGSLLLGAGTVFVAILVRRVRAAAEAPATTAGGGASTAMVAAGVAWVVVGIVAAPVAYAIVRWLRARRGAPRSIAGADEVAELVAIAVEGGVAPTAALRIAGDHLPELAASLRRLAFGIEMGTDLTAPGSTRAATSAAGAGGVDGRAGPRPPCDPLGRIARLLAAATTQGAPVAPNLRRFARELRADDLARVLAAAERLPVQLTFPTALCLLPATVLLVGAPIVHAGLVGAGL